LLVIKRGYSIIKKNDVAVASINSLKKGDNINIELMDGEVNANIVGVKKV